MKRLSLLMFLTLCLFTSNAFAASYVTVVRSWENPTDLLKATLTVQVQETHYDSQGNPHSTIDTKWVHVDIKLINAAPLRKGEVEYFTVTGHGGGSSSINVHVEPELTYYAYASGWTSVFGEGGYANVNLKHNGRIKNIPPITINEVNVAFTTPDKPFKLTFNDFAINENSEAQTTYFFEIERHRILLPNKPVAKGILKASESGKLKVILTKDSPYCNDGSEYFKDRKKYIINFSMKREGSHHYLNKYSRKGSLSFWWETTKGFADLQKVNSYEKEKKKTQRFNKMYKQPPVSR